METTFSTAEREAILNVVNHGTDGDWATIEEKPVRPDILELSAPAILGSEIRQLQDMGLNITIYGFDNSVVLYIEK